MPAADWDGSSNQNKKPTEGEKDKEREEERASEGFWRAAKATMEPTRNPMKVIYPPNWNKPLFQLEGKQNPTYLSSGLSKSAAALQWSLEALSPSLSPPLPCFFSFLLSHRPLYNVGSNLMQNSTITYWTIPPAKRSMPDTSMVNLVLDVMYKQKGKQNYFTGSHHNTNYIIGLHG